MLRYYEHEGLLNPKRTDSGYRDYGSDEVHAAQRIRTLTAAGLKISSIRLLLPCVLGEKPVFHPCGRGSACIAARRNRKLDARLRELSETREVVVRLLDAVNTNETLPL